MPLLVAALLLALLTAVPAHAADPQRGEAIYRSPLAPAVLPCTDCHSENPQVSSFGNIWAGRNAPALIERAIASNTGGMGMFQPYVNAEILADIAAWLGNTPSRLDFALTPLGATSARQRITVSSSIKADITGLTLAVEGDFVIAATSCGAVVARLSDCTVDIAFRPSADGPRQGVLLINHQGTPSAVGIPLRGQGRGRPPAVANLSPTSLDLGRAAIGLAGAVRGVRLLNGSNDPLALGAIGTSAAEFVVAGGSCFEGLVLAGGQACVVALRLQPDAAGARQGQLVIEHDGVGGRSTAALSGLAEASTTAVLQAEPGTIDLGAAPLGGRVRSDSIVIVNRGASAATLRTLATGSDALAVDPGRCGVGTQLAPGQRCSFTLTWSPTRPGRFSGELNITADPGSGSVRMPWSAQAGVGTLRAAPARLGFEAAAGGSALRHARLINRGSEPLRLQSIALTGPEAADFSLAPGGDCSVGALLAPATACTVAVQFAPRGAGLRSARLETRGEGSEAFVVELQGRTTAAARPSWWIDRTSLEVGASPGERQRIELHNRGSLAATPVLGIVGTAAGDFTLGGECRRILAPRERCTIEIGTAARAPGERTASLRVASDDGSEVAIVSLQSVTPTLPPAAASPRNGPVLAIGDAPVAFSITVFPSAVSATSGWAFNGPAADDFSLDPTSPCVTTRPSSGQRCELRLWFHPRAPGHRRAALQATGANAAPVASLEGWALGPPQPQLQAEPAELVFDARAGQPAPPQTLQARNEGLAPLLLQAAQLRGSGFTLSTTSPQACRPEGASLLLLPGQDCTIEITWSGGAAAAAGAQLLLDTDDPFVALQRPLRISEDPAQTSNIGTGGGRFGWLATLAMLVAALLLHRRRKELP